MVTVIDASVAINWFLPEAESSVARDLLVTLAGAIIVPDIFLIEVTGALVRQANMTKSERQTMERHIERLSDLFAHESLRAQRLHHNQTAQAAKLAINLGRPLKDCIYLTLAIELGCPLITADAKFAAKARAVYGDVRVLGVMV